MKEWKNERMKEWKNVRMYECTNVRMYERAQRGEGEEDASNLQE